MGFDSTVCPWELFPSSNPPDKEILSKIHDHAGVVRPWSEILWLQLKSMYVARYGADYKCPMYEPVVSKWVGKETLATAHVRDLRYAVIEAPVDIASPIDVPNANYIPPASPKRRCEDDESHNSVKKRRLEVHDDTIVEQINDVDDAHEVPVDDVFEEQVSLSRGCIKEVIFNLEWSEKSAKIQVISRVVKGKKLFLRVFDGLDNTAQCSVDDEDDVREIPDNAIIEVFEAELLMGSRIVIQKFSLIKLMENPPVVNLDDNFLNKEFFTKYFSKKGILREDGNGIREDCPEYQPSPIKMRTRSKVKTNASNVPSELPIKRYLGLRSVKKPASYICQDCCKSFISEGPLVKYMDKVHY